MAISGSGAIEFDGNNNPIIQNSSGAEVFSVDSGTGLPKVNGDIWPSDSVGALINDGSGNLDWGYQYRTVNAQTGTTYTFVLNDEFVTFNNSGAITVTVPTHSSVPYDNFTSIDMVQMGVGQVTIVPSEGVNLYSYVNKTSIAGQYAGATLKMLSTDNWILVGNLA